MKFYELLTQVIGRLVLEGRVTYRALQREFDLDDALLADLREELIVAKRLAIDEDGKVLVWREWARLVAHSDADSLQSFTAFGTGVLSTASQAALLPVETQAVLPDQRVEHTDGPAVTPAAVTVNTPEAERRQLTVMFCDLVGSTALSGQLDPEDLREVVRAYQETAAEVIARFEGHIAQYLGDGLLVYFGYPRAHEDDAQRAVRTGLEIIETIQTLNTRLEPDKGVRLAVRLGIHTGLVVVGEMGGGGRHEQLALGETPNIAARLEGLAEPNAVVISAATARLVQGLFSLEDLGPQSLKGVAKPIAVSRVLGPVEEQPAADEASSDQPVFLVGRDEEVGLLRRRWEQSKEGMGQVVLISGEAGIGKTSLVDTLRFTAPREGSARITLRCSAYYQNSALYPILEHLQTLLSGQPETSAEAQLDNLEELFKAGSLSVEESIPLFADLLSLPIPEGRYPPLNLSPQQHKLHTQDALVAWLIEEAEREHVLITWEDLQWADPSTLEILGLVIDQTPTIRMLNVLTHRPEFIPPWPMRSHMTPLTLNRLERLQAEALITHCAGSKVLPSDVIQHVVEKTDGVPLFVEELIKMILESDLLQQVDGQYELTGPLSALAIPSTLQDSLMARLDRLPEVRALAQLGAVLGREFAFEVVRAVTTEEDAVLQGRLTQLVEAELLYQRGRPPRAKYIFKHALLQDAAYTSLLRSTRQQYHQQIAQLFEQQFPEIVETQPEVVAHHYSEAGLNEQAIVYWQRAGERAVQRSAYMEAINHLTKGLELIETLPDTPERIQQELTVQVTLGSSLLAIKGFAAPDLEKAYTRARELSQQVGDAHQLSAVLFTLHRLYAIRADMQGSREMAEECMRIAQSNQDPTLLLTAHATLGAAALWLGEYTAALEHFEQGMALYNSQQHRSLAFLFGEDPSVACGSFAAWVLWYLGYPDQAREKTAAALISAQERSYPPDLAWGLLRAAWLHQYRGEGQAAQEQAESAISLSTDHGFPFFLAVGTFLRGWALAEQEKVEDGLAQMYQGLAAFQETGTELMRPYLLAVLAETQRKVGQPQEGLRQLAPALTSIEETGEYWSAAELYRLKGELLLGVGEHEEAEASFSQALDIARRQEAKSWELRAATSLAHLWQQQGKIAEARGVLAPVYEWFTEGFETKDLKDAKELLETVA